MVPGPTLEGLVLAVVLLMSAALLVSCKSNKKVAKKIEKVEKVEPVKKQDDDIRSYDIIHNPKLDTLEIVEKRDKKQRLYDVLHNQDYIPEGNVETAVEMVEEEWVEEKWRRFPPKPWDWISLHSESEESEKWDDEWEKRKWLHSTTYRERHKARNSNDAEDYWRDKFRKLGVIRTAEQRQAARETDAKRMKEIEECKKKALEWDWHKEQLQQRVTELEKKLAEKEMMQAAKATTEVKPAEKKVADKEMMHATNTTDENKLVEKTAIGSDKEERNEQRKKSLDETTNKTQSSHGTKSKKNK